MAKTSSGSKKKIILIVSCIVVLALVGGAFSFLAYGASTDKVFGGVYVGDVYVGGMSEDEAGEAIEKRYSSDEINPCFSHSDAGTFQVYGSQINLGVDASQSAKKAVAYGKEGSVFHKIAKMIDAKTNTAKLDVCISCDMGLLDYALKEHIDEYVKDVEQYSVEIGSDCLVITNGKDGYGVDITKLMEEISASYTKGELDTPIELKTETLACDPIDIDIFCEQYNREAVDAECTSDGESITIIPEVIGVTIDCDEAKDILRKNADNTQSYTIPAKITFPSVTAAQLEAEFTDCIIGTYSTDYSTSSPNRKENIRLAAAKINGLILNPGEVFSFNGIVGPRTAANGYKIAHVYVGSKVVDGLGGGICQVSSTLYNAVVFADLEIVYRTNHSMPVSYVPIGRDATVSYGSIDFKFKNNKTSPVKIEAIANGSTFTINIYGKKKYLKDISIENVITGSRPFSTREIEDETMYEGEREIEEKGSYGTNVATYKIVKQDGEIISKTFLAKSSYTPITQVERVGVKKREPQPDDIEVAAPDEKVSSDAIKSDGIPEDTVSDKIIPIKPDEPVYELPVEPDPPIEVSVDVGINSAVSE